jgi:predicted AlkP superfamily phosphohydrolase/phosphomutase
MDAIVGKARRLAGEGAVLIVLSDHGFSSFRRGVNYNTWLVRNGFMTLKGQGEDPATLEKLFDTRELFLGVDWSRTKAYALGLGSIYINLAGREREGAVQPGPEYEQVCRDIRLGLEALVDPLTGAHPVTRVWTRDEMYTGYDPDLIPDLRAGNNLNYRVSCQTTLGGVPPDLIEDNLRAWSGDHCSSDPDLIPGILFLNRKLDNPRPHIMDIMPTVLDLMGIEVPPEVDGKSLL